MLCFVCVNSLCPPHLVQWLWSRCCFADSHSWGAMGTSESHRWHPWPPAPSLLLLLPRLPLLIHCWKLSPAGLRALRMKRRKGRRRWRRRCWPWRRWGESGRELALKASHQWWSKVQICFASCPSFSSSPRRPLLLPLLRRSPALRAGAVCSQRTHRGLSSR